MKQGLFFLIAAFLFLHTNAQDFKFKTVSVLDGKAEIQLPDSFTILKEEYRKKKYPGKNAPKVIYSNDETTINIGIGDSLGAATQEDIPDFMKALEGSLKGKLKNLNDWWGSGIVKSNGKDVGYCEFISEAIDTKIYNFIFFTDIGGQLYLFTFNAANKNYDLWKEVSRKIMTSLKVKS
jgi:hypothetical protein